MSKAIAKLGAGTIMSLPPRLATLAGAVGTVRHPGQAERHHLQAGWAMSDMEKREAASLLSTLTSDLSPGAPFEGEDGAMAKGVLLTKMIRGLAGAEGSEIAAVAKIEMYADAIEDLPAWSIDKAVRRWGKGDCPRDIVEKPRFEFPPSPAALRALALLDLDLPRRYVRMLSNLVATVPMERALDPEPLPSSSAVSPLRRM